MPKTQNRLIWILLAALCFFLGYLVISAQDDTQAKRAGGGQENNVRTAKVAMAPLSREVKALGTALAYDSAKIVSATSDYLTLLQIREGTQVKKGEIIAQLNDTEEKARVNELAALLAEQKRQLARLKNLTQTQASAISLLDEQQAKVNATQAQLDAVQARLNEMVIRAPFDGLIGLRQVSEGAFISAGTVLTTLDDISTIRVEFNVAERYLASLTPGLALRITNVAYGNEVFSGEIKALDPRIDPVTRSIKVHGVIANQSLKLRPGMLLTVQVELAQSQVLQIPEKAIVPLQNKHYVFVVDAENKVTQREVVLGERIPGSVEVLSGLSEGDEIVIEGTQKLRSGVTINRVEQ